MVIIFCFHIHYKMWMPFILTVKYSYFFLLQWFLEKIFIAMLKSLMFKKSRMRLTVLQVISSCCWELVSNVFIGCHLHRGRCCRMGPLGCFGQHSLNVSYTLVFAHMIFDILKKLSCLLHTQLRRCWCAEPAFATPSLQPLLLMSGRQFHRIPKLLIWKSLEEISVPTSCPEQGLLQHLTMLQLGSENLQEWSLPNPSGKPVPVFWEFFPLISNWILLYFPMTLVLLLCTSVTSLSLSFWWLPNRYGEVAVTSPHSLLLTRLNKPHSLCVSL